MMRFSRLLPPEAEHLFSEMRTTLDSFGRYLPVRDSYEGGRF
jgi:hypothetical protein